MKSILSLSVLSVMLTFGAMASAEEGSVKARNFNPVDSSNFSSLQGIPAEALSMEAMEAIMGKMEPTMVPRLEDLFPGNDNLTLMGFPTFGVTLTASKAQLDLTVADIFSEN